MVRAGGQLPDTLLWEDTGGEQSWWVIGARTERHRLPLSFSHVPHPEVRTWSTWPLDQGWDQHMMAQLAVQSPTKPP